jgi:histone deacetylase 1/2
VLRRGGDIVYLLLYVDDIVLTGSSTGLLQHVVDRLRAEFAVKDMGELWFFLDIDVKRTADGFYLSQERYAKDILERVVMKNCKPIPMPIDAKDKVSTDGAPIDDASSYRSLAGALMYLNMTRPNLAFAVQQACLHMHDPRVPHLTMLKWILRYVHGTTLLGLHLRSSASLDVTAYSDTD